MSLSTSSTAIEVAGNYMRKMVGVDFLVKLLGYLVRFRILYLSTTASNPPLLSAYQNMLGSIVESRMLSNAFKGPSTLMSSLKCLNAPTNPRDRRDGDTTLASLLQSPVKLLSFLSLFMRAFEQFSSDGGYLSRYVFKTWNKEMLTREYKRWKSLSLTCMAIVEAAFLARYFSQQRAANGKAAATAIDKKLEFPSPSKAGNGNGHGEEQQQQDNNGSASSSSSSSPLLSVASPRGNSIPASPNSTLAPSPPPAASFYKYRFQALAANANIESRDAVFSGIVLTRCVCDMYIYYRWIESWQPPEFWQYSAGIVSAVLGIYLVLDESIRDVRKQQQQQQQQVEAARTK